MAVFQPTAILGNGLVLVSLGHSGEVMSFFYPHCDSAQNIKEGLSGIFLEGYGFSWFFGGEWQKQQRYLSGEATLLTELTCPTLGLKVSSYDLVLPEEPIFLRRWQVRSLDGKPKLIQLLHFFHLTLDDSEWQQAVQVVKLSLPTPRPAIIQWRQRNWCGISSDLPFQLWQCGKALESAPSHPKSAMVTGHLTGQSLEIGKVAFAFGWRLPLSASGVVERTIAIAFGGNKEEVLSKLGWTLSKPFEDHRNQHHHEWQSWFRRLTSPAQMLISKPFAARSVFETALVTLRLLWDKQAGSPVAAVEFDPTYEASGGYGYCWCRDASFIAHAFSELGMAQKASRFFEWCEKAQSPDGFFHQRYWLDGNLAPAWSEDHDNLQIDQTASIVWSAEQVLRHVPARLSVKIWTVVMKALAFLESRLDNDVHQTGMDLWETFRGSFTYTQASIVAAFQSGAKLAAMIGEHDHAKHWQVLAEKTKTALIQKFWSGKGFLRGFTSDGHPDYTEDASVLGVIFPFSVLDLNQENQRQIAEATVKQVIESLAKETSKGSLSVWRFSGDSYAWGMASTPATIWLGLAATELASRNCNQKIWNDVAHRCLRTCMQHTTPAGLLAEMFDPFGKGYWAVGHGWSAAWFLLLTMRLKPS